MDKETFIDFLLNYGWGILVSLVAVGLLLYFGVLVPGPAVTEEESAVITNTTNTTVPRPTSSPINRLLFKDIAEHLAAERKYEAGPWDCSNMSEELARRLNTQGYNSTDLFIFLYYNNGTYRGGHSITKLTVYIESTNGLVISPEEYKYYVTNNYTMEHI